MKKLILLLLLIPLQLFSQFCPKCKYELKNDTYTVDYDTANRIPRFVYYIYQTDKIGTWIARPAFKTDERVQSSATPFDYLYSGYDKGHLFPYASAQSIRACEECMLMTNIAPQTHRFNRGIWSYIEGFERINASPIAYIITGTITSTFDKKIGNKVDVPVYFYKIVYNPTKGMIVFLASQEINDYKLITVDALERLTGN